MDEKLQDSGERIDFGEGKAIREPTEGKGRFDLLCSQMIVRQARHFEKGAEKYKDGRNWEKGMPVSRLVDSALRHIFQYIMGCNDEPHLDAAIWNLGAITYYEQKFPEMMDLPERKDMPLEELQKYCVMKPDTKVRTLSEITLTPDDYAQALRNYKSKSFYARREEWVDAETDNPC